MSYNLALGWGLSTTQIQQEYPQCYTSNTDNLRQRHIICGMGRLYNMWGDCSTLLLDGANNIKEEDLKVLMGIASKCGFNKLFATITDYNYKSRAKNQRDMFKSLGWRCVDSSKSNRTPEKVSYSMFLRIKDPIQKGY